MELRNLEVNNKLISLGGVIGKRDYIYNILMAYVISGVLTAPMYITFLKSPYTFFENIDKIDLTRPMFVVYFQALPLWMSVLLLVSFICVCGIYFTTLSRRISDLANKPFDWKNCFGALALTFLILNGNQFIGQLSLLILIIFAILDGKATKNIPHKDVKKFNWSAFFGTFIWGLFNKSYKTLFMIPLIFTPALVPFAIICGMKGNEWACKDKSEDDIAEFLSKQGKNTVWYAIWSVVSYTVVIISIIVMFVMSGWNLIKNNGNDVYRKIDGLMTNSLLMIVDKIEITPEKCSYYVNPKVWKEGLYSEKVQLIDILKVYSKFRLIKYEFDKVECPICEAPELERFKVYSSYNNEVLAEYRDAIENIGEADNAKDKYKAVAKALVTPFYINDNPVVP